MRSVAIPAGLRSRLATRIAAEQGAILRRTALRYCGVAATIMLAIGLYLGAIDGPPQAATEEWVSPG